MTQEIVPTTASSLPGSTGHDVPAVHNDGGAVTPPDGLIERLAQKMGLSAAAASVYGAPIEQGGVTVIPVARVRYGFGAGGGSDPKDGSTGAGGGGGVIAKPSGYIEIGNGTSKFHRIDDPTEILGAVALMIVASGAGMFLVFRGFSKIYRGSGARRRR